MRLHKKAFYNLLRFHFLKGELTRPKPWQVENLRDRTTHDLFERLQSLGISLETDSFLEKASHFTNPETLTDSLLPLDRREADPIYLLIFELWRRLLPQEKSLSLFCDELDYKISLYYQQEPLLEEEMQTLLGELKQILDESGSSKKEIFENFSLNCAHDLEHFLYIYTSQLLDQKFLSDADEILQDFYPYISHPLWFDFLKAKMKTQMNAHSANLLLQTLLEDIEKSEDLDLLFEVLSFLVSHADPHLFQKAGLQALKWIHTEKDLGNLLAKTAAYFRGLDKEKQEKEVQALLNQHTGKDLDSVLDPEDPSLAKLKKYLELAIAPLQNPQGLEV